MYFLKKVTKFLSSLLNKEMRVDPTLRMTKGFPRKWVSGGWHIPSGAGRGGGGVSGGGNGTDESREASTSMVCQGDTEGKVRGDSGGVSWEEGRAELSTLSWWFLRTDGRPGRDERWETLMKLRALQEYKASGVCSCWCCYLCVRIVITNNLKSAVCLWQEWPDSVAGVV